jgi:hypothetical protein
VRLRDHRAAPFELHTEGDTTVLADDVRYGLRLRDSEETTY